MKPNVSKISRQVKKERRMMNIKDKYDVVVIGAGIGGLTCGAYLAKAGLGVLVTEQHTKPGGYCASFRRKGFQFDTGVDGLSGAERGGLFCNILEELELENKIEFIELAFPSRITGSDYDVPSMPVEAHANELKRMFPGESTAIDVFLQDCIAVKSEMFALMEPAPDLLGFGGKMGLMVRFLLKSPKVRRYGGKSYQQALIESFKQPKLRAILASVDHVHPGWAATSMMFVLGFHAFQGFQYPKGGAQALADVFAKALTEHGGDLALKTLVKKIVVDNGKASGVELADGTRVNSRYIVSSIDGRQTFLKLVGEQYLAPKSVRELREARLADPFFLVSLGVDMNLRAMGFDGTSIVYNRSDNIDDLWSGDADKSSLWIMMHSLRDPSLAPEGMATVQIMTPFPYKYMNYWKREADGTRGKEYRELKEALASKLIASVEALIPHLSQHIVCKDIATPLTYERYTLNSEGASYGWFPLPGAAMRSQKTAIKNLYQAGHWTFPCGSVFAVAFSGRNAAQLVLREVKAK
jgi:all-trans-retinol 13,14-reductase